MNLAAPRYLAVGRIGRAHGVRGELAVDVLTDFPERFESGARFYVGPEQPEPGPDLRPVVLESARSHNDRLLVTFDVARDRTEASQLTGMFLFIPVDEARALEEGSFYVHELVGLEAHTVDGQELGTVTSVIETGSADVLVLEDGQRSRLVPMIARVIVAVDVEGNSLTVAPLPGLFD